MSDAPGSANDSAGAKGAGVVRIRRALREEAEAVASVVRAAFQTVADEIGIDIPPAHESAADVLATFDAGDVTLVAEALGGALVGTVRSEAMDDGSIMVRRLGVLPAWRGRGVARALMLALESEYPGTSRFELFTGAMAVGPLALYESLGYRFMEPRDTGGFPIVYLEKCID